MPERNGGESWIEEIQGLDVEMEQFAARKKECESQIRRLLFEEDPGSGKVFAAQIHALQQERLRLEVEIDLRRKRKNRLRLAQEEAGSLKPPRTS